MAKNYVDDLNFHRRVTLMRLEPSRQRHTFRGNFIFLLLDQSVCYKRLMNSFSTMIFIHVRKNNAQARNLQFLSFFVIAFE